MKSFKKSTNTLKETIEKKLKREKYLKILLATIFCISLLSVGFVIGNPKVLTNIKGSLENLLRKDTSKPENEDTPGVVEEEEKEFENIDDALENLIEENKPPVEESSKTQKTSTTKTTTPTETEPTAPILKCTQYEYDFATAFIPAATEVYNELYASYLSEVAEYETCRYGQTWNELYQMCDSKLSSLITDPAIRSNLNYQCIQNYYSDCEMNDSSDWYARQMEDKLVAINEQKAILASCY